MFRTKKSIVAIVILLLLLTEVALNAQENEFDQIPTNFLIEYGIRHYDEGALGLALRIFREAKERRSVYPEIDYWIGKVFEAENEYGLAILQYQTALENQNNLEVPDTRFTILYDLAAIYEDLDDFNSFESTLVKIVELDANKRGDSPVPFDAMVNLLQSGENGIDKLLELFRLRDEGGMMAMFHLGRYLYKNGRVSRALQYLTAGSVITLSTVIDYQIQKDPEYRFTDLDSTMADTLKNRRLAEFLALSGIFPQLYYLADCLWILGERGDSESLWKTVATFAIEEEWQRRASQQLLGFEPEQIEIER